MTTFCLKNQDFHTPARYIRTSDLKDRRFRSATSPNLFLSKPLHEFLVETKKRFASIEDSFGFSALGDLPETFKKFEQNPCCTENLSNNNKLRKTRQKTLLNRRPLKNETLRRNF